jgi:uncharacterized protein YggE
MRTTLCAWAVFLGLVAGPAFSQEGPDGKEVRAIEVTGTGWVTFAPKSATVLLVVEDTSTSAVDSLKQCTTRANAVRQDLEALKIPGLRLQQGPAHFFAGSLGDVELTLRREMTCRLNIAAVLDLSAPPKDLSFKAAALIDAAARSGAYPAVNPGTPGHLFFRVERMAEVRGAVHEKALADARERAEGLAKAGGVTCGAVHSVREVWGGREREETDTSFASLFSSCPPGETWIFDGKVLKWRKSLRVRFRIENK